MDKKDYISIVYDTKRTPKTDYPNQLVKYLNKKFEFKEKSRLLEIGCGRGDFLTAFQNENFDCVGIDRERSSIEMSHHLKIFKCDISKDRFPFDDNLIDIVYHKSVIEHLYDPIHLMQETYRVLKPGGKLIILTPDWHTQMKNFYEDFTHSRPYDRGAMTDLLAIFGYKNIIVEKFYQLPNIWKYPVLKIFASLLRLCINVYGGRWLTDKTGIKFFRWSVELMILGYGEK